jgi:hypothetical protein
MFKWLITEEKQFVLIQLRVFYEDVILRTTITFRSGATGTPPNNIPTVSLTTYLSLFEFGYF